MAKDRSLVRASDIGAWGYCRRAWWLANVRKVAHANPERLQVGTAQHQLHGQRVHRSLRWRRIGAWLIICGVVLAVVLLVLSGMQ